MTAVVKISVFGPIPPATSLPLEVSCIPFYRLCLRHIWMALKEDGWTDEEASLKEILFVRRRRRRSAPCSLLALFAACPCLPPSLGPYPPPPSPSLLSPSTTLNLAALIPSPIMPAKSRPRKREERGEGRGGDCGR